MKYGLVFTTLCRGLGLWCLMPLSTIFQLYRGSSTLCITRFHRQTLQTIKTKNTNVLHRPFLICIFIALWELSICWKQWNKWLTLIVFFFFFFFSFYIWIKVPHNKIKKMSARNNPTYSNFMNEKCLPMISL